MQNNSIPSDKEGNSVGTILKQARESGGLTLNDAARVTRIGKDYLRALEEGRYDRLPNDAYIKGFLRVYATYLKLPEEEIVVAYEKLLSDQNPSHCTFEHENDQNKISRKSTGLPVARMYPAIIFIALVALLAYLFVIPAGKSPEIDGRKDPNDKNTATIPGDSKFRAVSPPAVKENGNESPAQQVDETKKSGADKDNEGLVGVSPLSKGLILKIKVVEDGWLDVTIDDAVSQHYELKSGDLIEWKGERGFTLDIGNAGGVEAELNGRKLKPFGKTGETAHVVLNTGGIRN